MDDLISRQETIDIINTYAVPIHGYIGTPNDSEVYAYARGLLLSIERNMRALPSAEPEIIRCKDCMWWDTSWKPTWAIGEEHWCSSNDTFMWPKDYCSKAERIES